MSTAQVNELKTIDGTKSVQVADIADGNVGIGVGQTWQNMTSSRELDVDYINDTGRPIMVSITFAANDGTFEGKFMINGTTVGRVLRSTTTGDQVGTLVYIIPYGAVYKASTTSSDTIEMWHELREVI